MYETDIFKNLDSVSVCVLIEIMHKYAYPSDLHRYVEELPSASFHKTHRNVLLKGGYFFLSKGS